EVWTYPAQGVGDCEDYVLEKRRRLHRLGVSLSNLLITVVRKPDGEGHAVLTVRTSNGDFILDNLTDKVRPWDETGYRFLKRQATDHTGRWVSIRDDQTVLVGSVQYASTYVAWQVAPGRTDAPLPNTRPSSISRPSEIPPRARRPSTSQGNMKWAIPMRRSGSSTFRA